MDYGLYRRLQYNDNHVNCASCGEVTHKSELNEDCLCQACTVSHIDEIVEKNLQNTNEVPSTEWDRSSEKFIL